MLLLSLLLLPPLLLLMLMLILLLLLVLMLAALRNLCLLPCLQGAQPRPFLLCCLNTYCCIA